MPRLPARVLPILVLAHLLASSPVPAAGDERPAGRFDAILHQIEGGGIAVAPRPLEDLYPADPMRAGWEAFARSAGGRWRIYLDERSGLPTLVTGPGIPWYSEKELEGLTLERLEGRARAFLTDHAALLGEWGDILELDAEASGLLGEDHWQLVFRQRLDGALVENSRLDLHVQRGRLTLLGATHWARPDTGGRPSIDANEARAFLGAYLGSDGAGLVAASEPELVIVALDAEPSPDGQRRWGGKRGEGLRHALLWRVPLREPGGPGLWIGEIDARDGSVLAFYDGAHHAGVQGAVFPGHPNGDCTDGGCELVQYPMPYAEWSQVGGGSGPSDAYGNFLCSDPEASFQTTLDGPYARVEDTCGPLTAGAGCDSVLDLGRKAGENCQVAPGESAGNTAAARTSYYHVNRVSEAARFYNPGNAWLQAPVTLHTNWNGACNASYGNDSIYVYQSNYRCANTGEITSVIVHEWGHGYDENDGGSWDRTSEAYGDVVAMLATRDSCFAKGMRTDGTTCSGYGDTCLTCTGFRDHDWAARQANTPATPQGFVTDNCDPGTGTQSPCGGQVHCESHPIDESIWDLATRDLPASGMDQASAWQLVERLWLSTRQGSGGMIYTCALPDSDSCAASSWYQRMRAADDEDGDLANGTPHAAALFAAFDRHNIACGLATDPENQSSSSCPALDSPLLALDESGPGTELSWNAVAGAAEYLVFRGEMGCARQLVPIATLGSGETSFLDTVGDPGVQRFYRVQAVGSNGACRSPVSACTTGSAGPRLQQNGHRVVEEGSNVNLNGKLDPGETVTLPVTLLNGGSGEAVGVGGRLRTVDPSTGRVVDPLSRWPDMLSGEELESEEPHFELTLFEGGIACGEVVELEIEMSAAGAPARTARFEIPLGTPGRDYLKQDGQLIPRQTPSPVLSTLEVTDQRSIAELDISVSISHPGIDELIVELSSPEGTTVRLHDNSGSGAGLFTRYDLETEPDGPGAMADFEGEQLAGTWTLSVRDTVYGAFGQAYLNEWTLHATAVEGYDCEPLACGEPAPTEAPSGLLVDDTAQGDGAVDLHFSWDGVAGAAGYHVLHSGSPAYDEAVDLTGRTDGATTLTVLDGGAQTPPLAFFQVRAVNGCNEESP